MGDEEKRALRSAGILSWAGKVEGRLMFLERNDFDTRIEKLEGEHGSAVDSIAEIRQVTSRIESLARRVESLEKKEKPDYISWHSVERIQELEAWVRKAGKTLDGLKHQSDLAADYVVGLGKRINELEKQPRITEITGTPSKPHICGECRHPWRKEGSGGLSYMLACKLGDKSAHGVVWKGLDDTACGLFKQKGESCTG